jgi:choline dehydrogenase
VLLLEAGPPDDAEEIRVPAATPTLWRGRFAWEDATVPQPGAADRTVIWPHGRILGGSSSINGMVYVRGNQADYDAWREVHGCAGWGYADLLPYFRTGKLLRTSHPPYRRWRAGHTEAAASLTSSARVGWTWATLARSW